MIEDGVDDVVAAPEVKANLEAAARGHRSQPAVPAGATGASTSTDATRVSDAAVRIVERDRAVLTRLA
ncbi:hypothetical protein [Cellulomonas sp. SLBN-39]|uniref:hypothetical protein n=1 Tax=Cellulomonas sp. SLBN-39 TaxID=2768446 RepID=UPI001154E759|nr:hypothetical protein [Cellulomonas sp. SLBN-39]